MSSCGTWSMYVPMSALLTFCNVNTTTSSTRRPARRAVGSSVVITWPRTRRSSRRGFFDETNHSWMSSTIRRRNVQRNSTADPEVAWICPASTSTVANTDTRTQVYTRVTVDDFGHILFIQKISLELRIFRICLLLESVTVVQWRK